MSRQARMRNINQRPATLAQLGPKHGSVGLMIFYPRPDQDPHLVMNNYAARKRAEVSPAAVRCAKLCLTPKRAMQSSRRIPSFTN
jgi:hypothetical protein